MDANEIRNKIITIVSETAKIEKDKIKGESHFIDDLNLDSLDMVELMMKMEDEFDLEIPEHDTENLKTINDAVNYLMAKKPA